MKGSLLPHWVPGASANFCYFFSIQAKLGFPGKAPVCSALITQVPPPLHPNPWVPVSGANWVPVSGAQTYKIFLEMVVSKLF